MRHPPYQSQVIKAMVQWAEDAPGRIALRSQGQEMRYAELLAASQELANRLIVEKLRCVGLSLNNGIEWCIADLATILAGIPLVPLPPFFTAQQHQHALLSAGADALITYNEGWVITSLPHTPRALPPQTAKVTYTSGTTGTPKGVCLSQQGMETVSLSLLNRVGAGNAQWHLALLPLAVLLENIAGFYTTMLAGGCYVVEPPAVLGFQGMQPDGRILLAHLSKHTISSCILVPEYLLALLQALAHHPIPLPELRFMAVGGAKVPEALIEKARGLGLPVYQGYGLSESASVVAVNTPSHNKNESVGRILPHIHHYIAKDGELILDHPAFLGYVGEKPHAGPYETGDTVRMDAEGFLFIVGRKRNVIITSHGRNVSPEWPESELLMEPAIRQVVVVGEARPYLAALVVPASPDADIANAITSANARLPEYVRIMAWQSVEPFTPTNGMLTANGRTIRQRIEAHHQPLIKNLFEERRKAYGIL